MNINSYISLPFLAIFLPAVILLYLIFPKKAKPFILLLASAVFFIFISKWLIFYMIFTTLLVYFLALGIQRLNRKQGDQLASAEDKEQKKLIKKQFASKRLALLLCGIIINIGILALLKYSTFFLTNLNSLLKACGSSTSVLIPHFMAPIGISFYTLQAVSYIHDVYKGKIEADKNLGRVALFMSFFPIIMEGPICRYADTAEALWSGKRIEFKNLSFGLQRIAFGMMKKIVIADRVNLIVRTIFRDFTTYHYDGGVIALGVILYTLELYMEFSGTIDVVIGTGEIFGVNIPENFRRPFFAKSISEFWQRWHITLGTWFKDYIFYPVSMSKRMKKLTRNCRKKFGREYGPLPASIIAFFCVWLCNGLWHGSDWQYVFFGMYHFVLISLGALILPLSNKLFAKLKIDKSKLPYKIFAILRTAFLVCIGELFFNSRSLPEGLSLFSNMVSRFSLRSFLDGSIFTLGFDRYDLIIVIITILIVFIVSLANEKGISVRQWLSERNIALRWAVLMALIIYVVVFGAYGAGYVPIDPIYANF